MNQNMSLVRIRDALETAGIKTSWQSPFMAFVHPEWNGKGNTAGYKSTSLYVPGIPSPGMVPVDIAEISLHVSDRGIDFFFTLYFHTVLKDAIEVEDFKRIYDTHERNWLPRLKEYYRDVASRFLFEWDVEYDESIEDTLHRTFATRGLDEIAKAARNIRFAGDWHEQI